MTKSALDRLNDQLEEKDEKIGALERELQEAKNDVANAEGGWAIHRKIDDDETLPLPRLEFAWTPQRDGDWSNYFCEYRMVYRHLLGHLVVVPLGLTKTGSSTGEGPFKRYPGSTEWPYLPFRDQAHAFHDAAHMNLLLYAITPDGPVLLDDRSREGSWTTDGIKHRRDPK